MGKKVSKKVTVEPPPDDEDDVLNETENDSNGRMRLKAPVRKKQKLSLGIKAAAALVVLLVLGVVIYYYSSDHMSNSPAPQKKPNKPEKQAIIDGKISDGEYINQYTEPAIGLQLSWSIYKGQIYIGLMAPSSGWMGIGWEPDGPMKKGSDIVIGYVLNGTLSLLDQFATQTTGHTPDTALGGTDDILEKAGNETNNRTTIEFRRNLATGDTYDKTIKAGSQEVLLAYSSYDDFVSNHNQYRASIKVDFFAGEVG